jgi:hypothetical protein
MREDRDEEIRFAKTQQWRVAIAALTLLGATFAVSHAMRPLACAEKAAGTVLVTLIGMSGAVILLQLQNHLAEKRREIKPDEASAWLRGGAVLFSLVAAVVIGAVVVGYSFWRSSS